MVDVLWLDEKMLSRTEEKRRRESGDVPWCCYIDPESGCWCKAKADYEIVHGLSPDDYTHSCEAHVVEMLTDAREHLLRRLGGE